MFFCKFTRKSFYFHPGKLKVSGNVVLPDSTTSPPPSLGSCLRMSIQEEILCEGCEVPELASFRISNPVVGDFGKIAYQMTLNNPKPGVRYATIVIWFTDTKLFICINQLPTFLLSYIKFDIKRLNFTFTLNPTWPFLLWDILFLCVFFLSGLLGIWLSFINIALLLEAPLIYLLIKTILSWYLFRYDTYLAYTL